MEGKADKAIKALENGLEDALSVTVLPKKYRGYKQYARKIK